jgi:serine/threonine protein kinase
VEKNSHNNLTYREIDIMRRIDNPHVMEMMGYIDTQSHVIIKMPIMFGGDLLQRIRDSPQKRLSEADSKFFILQILRGLSYMHQKGIAHRDVKSANLLLSNCGASPILKLADMGMSKFLTKENTICGTPVSVNF